MEGLPIKSSILPLLKHACEEVTSWSSRDWQVLHQSWISGTVYHIHLHQMWIRLVTLALKPRGDVTRSPKHHFVHRGHWLPSMHHGSHDQPPGDLHPEGLPQEGSASKGDGKTPPPELEKRTVRILLECFLVQYHYTKNHSINTHWIVFSVKINYLNFLESSQARSKLFIFVR